MGLIRRRRTSAAPPMDEELIDVKEAARLLGLDDSTVRKGLAGTGSLARVRLGNSQKPRIRLLRSEVLSYKRRLIDTAREQQQNHLRIVFKSEG